MTPRAAAAKRAFDLALAAVLLVPGLPVLAAIALAVRLVDGPGPIYASPRVGQGMRPFTLWKVRTMATDNGPEMGVTGGDKAHRITKLGAFLRRSRLDELPQLFNVLRGDMSFVGPRPPAPLYATRFPDIYADVLTMRPGITGLATVIYHAHEERILARCRSAAETDATYARRCVPWKARLDAIHRTRWSLALDLLILYLTAAKLLPLPGARAQRVRNRDNPSKKPQTRPALTRSPSSTNG